MIARILLVCLLFIGSSCSAQHYVLGKGPLDKFLPRFFEQNGNADTLIEGLNEHGTVPFAVELIPGAANVPSEDEKAAMAGTSGTPSDGNRFVTDADSRLSDSRAPAGAAGGDLAGSYPEPTLAEVGSAGTYTKVTTDAKGRVTSGASLAAARLSSAR